MPQNRETKTAGTDNVRRLFVFNAGFLTNKRVRRILRLSGYNVRLGAPGPDDLVGVWGNSPTAYRGEAVANQLKSNVVRIEDPWLRSLFPGRSQGEPPIGLVVDHAGVHYDPNIASDLEMLLSDHPLDDTALLNRARCAMARLKETHLTKYSAVDPEIAPPAPGYVLVIDQIRGDASVRACGADRNRFLEMLVFAQQEHPGARILIKTHPETMSEGRAGHFEQKDLTHHISFHTSQDSPWHLLEGAIAVYTVSSQLGFEAILAGHRPRVFGAPFYAGWGLTEDEFPVPRRQRKLTVAQIFAAAALLYPKWYDPFSDRLCDYETALENLAAQTRCWREDRFGWVASGMRLWKRASLQKMFGRHCPMIFDSDPSRQPDSNKRRMVWANGAAKQHDKAVLVEDGFLRSRGLGAALVPAISLITDDTGIYYDATRPSHLESLISARQSLRPDQQKRADVLIRELRHAGLTKYNLGGHRPELPEGHRILVVGQVADDASLLYGGGDVRSNDDLLAAARQHNPDAILVYKPHPDTEAGLRDGGTTKGGLADSVVPNADPIYLIENVHEVWTMTSLLGFEALIRGTPVTTLGVPFYAGWGLTSDRVEIPQRRQSRPSLAGLVHACLIDYPRYIHPGLNMPCPVEAAISWLEQTETKPPMSPFLRLLSKTQGIFASKSRWWR